ncbi:hypothetical protein [uncultured Sphingomonas sp.]|uniref:hypothetical protein n=1 Tax=uncultured Sphingomonas sp. TaxID=158754 RepID=UPI00261B4FF7|nr:hypothetical protein [uncultured Sphingomonas sp.]
MDRKRILLLALIGAAGIAVSACADDYGYGGMSVGYGVPGYYDGYGYGDGYWGWYGDYYYPGTGVYVYDRYRRPYRWNDDQRRYWQGRGDSYWHGRPGWNGQTMRPNPRPNWHGFGGGRGGGHSGGGHPPRE